MMSIPRALRPASRRILSARPVVAAIAVPARWQSNNSGPFNPVPGHEMAVGELEGAKFRIEPLRRTGEDAETMRARLTYQSRKRGTLESDLLLSTFAAAYLPHMSPEQMQQYDRFLDENDWDIYYWATQPEDASSNNTAAAGLQNSEPYLSDQGGPAATTMTTHSDSNSDSDGRQNKKKLEPASPAKGEWAQTIGTFKPAFRPVPQRWKGSEVLGLLRQHVKERSAAGVLGNSDREKAEGMAFMPALGERK
ncbi:TPR repeat protein [Diaporthe helianthi]|uniref:Succinate dehydrogenase assembly factor 2, mitochondrial n=1 Tax=Diaporthe helianthi TaxID=158607 RepID=A0A2P5ID51_DIAHE|nr:TPR repeat protein [Diaporthe helianthi]